MSDEPEIREWDPFHACLHTGPITSFQPVYYLANSFSEAAQDVQRFANSFQRTFSCRWNDVEEKLEVDRNIKRKERNLNDFGTYMT